MYGQTVCVIARCDYIAIIFVYVKRYVTCSLLHIISQHVDSLLHIYSCDATPGTDTLRVTKMLPILAAGHQPEIVRWVWTPRAGAAHPDDPRTPRL